MREILTVYQCDVCGKTEHTNDDIINVKLSTPEIYDEGPIDKQFLEFEICKECAGRCSINQLIEFFKLGQKGSD